MLDTHTNIYIATITNQYPLDQDILSEDLCASRIGILSIRNCLYAQGQKLHKIFCCLLASLLGNVTKSAL